MHLRSGDTVITRTWDSGGADWKGVKHIEHPYKYPESGNPLMGPFYIEGADYGDTIGVRLDKVRLKPDCDEAATVSTTADGGPGSLRPPPGTP